MLKKVYPRLKALDPAITIIGGVMSGNGTRDGWMEAACKAGLFDSLDAFSYHPYCYGAPGGERRPDSGLVKRILQNAEIMRRYDKRNTPVYITEIGWPTYDGPMGSTPEDEARFLARSFLVVRGFPFIRGMWWYDFSDDGTDRNNSEDNFGIVTHDFAEKPAYPAMRDICRLFANAQYRGELEANPGIRIQKFINISGEILWAVWSADGREDWKVTFTKNFRSLSDPEPAAVMKIGSSEIEREWKLENGLPSISVKLSGMPVIIDTGFSEVTVTWHHADSGQTK